MKTSELVRRLRVMKRQREGLNKRIGIVRGRLRARLQKKHFKRAVVLEKMCCVVQLMSDKKNWEYRRAPDKACYSDVMCNVGDCWLMG